MYIFYFFIILLYIESFYYPKHQPRGLTFSVDLVKLLCPLFASYCVSLLWIYILCTNKTFLNKTKSIITNAVIVSSVIAGYWPPLRWALNSCQHRYHHSHLHHSATVDDLYPFGAWTIFIRVWFFQYYWTHAVIIINKHKTTTIK